jgi:GGDEF domain-containing protein
MQANQWPVTFSIGAAVFQESCDSVDEMVHAADQEMYAVKNRCKDEVSVTTVEAATA